MARHRTLLQLGRAVGLAATVLSLLLLAAVGLGPRTGRYRTLTVLTGSMRPALPEGSVVVETPTPLAEVGVGDVITYRIPVEDQRLVTHRVVEVIEAGAAPVVRTKGDANAAPDPWVARLEGERVWRVRGGVPKLGSMLEVLRQPAAKRLTLLVVPLVLALVWLRDIWATPAPGGPPSPARDPSVLPIRD